MKTCCFTGKRPKDLYGYQDIQSYVELRRGLSKLVEQLYFEGYRRFITGGAQGVDQVAFRAVYAVQLKHQGIRNNIYVPFVGQEKAWAEYGLFSQQEYHRLCALADDKINCGGHYLSDPKEVVGAFMKRNHRMVNDSHLVIGIVKQKSQLEGFSGTKEALDFARKLHKETRVLLTDDLIKEGKTKCRTQNKETC